MSLFFWFLPVFCCEPSSFIYSVQTKVVQAVLNSSKIFVFLPAPEKAIIYGAETLSAFFPSSSQSNYVIFGGCEAEIVFSRNDLFFYGCTLKTEVPSGLCTKPWVYW